MFFPTKPGSQEYPDLALNHKKLEHSIKRRAIDVLYEEEFAEFNDDNFRNFRINLVCVNPFKQEDGLISLGGSDPPGSSQLDEEEFSFRDAENDMPGHLNPIQLNRSLQVD